MICVILLPGIWDTMFNYRDTVLFACLFIVAFQMIN